MNGPWHYQAAEDLVSQAQDRDKTPTLAEADVVLKAAQVHATLALTAAALRYPYPPEQVEWDEVL